MSSNALLEHRVDRLEDVLIRLAEAQVETQRELLDFKNEMSEFKNEMRVDFEKYREWDYMDMLNFDKLNKK